MIKIENNQKTYELEFDGIKIINCNNTSKLFKQWFLDSTIYIDNKIFKQDDIIYISELTKISEFINFNKKSFLIDLINENIGDKKIINCDLIKNIIENINNKVDFELLIQNDGDNVKIIQQLFDILDDIFLNEKILKIIIEYQKKSKIFIFDNVSWIKLDFLFKYLNEHNFVILTNDFRSLMLNKSTIELVVNVKDNNDFVEFHDSEILFNHLEQSMSQTIDDQKFNDFIQKRDSFFSLQLLSKIKLI